MRVGGVRLGLGWVCAGAASTAWQAHDRTCGMCAAVGSSKDMVLLDHYGCFVVFVLADMRTAFSDPLFLQIDFVLADVPGLLSPDGDGERQLPSSMRKFADTVLMNPPFGTKKKGVDMEFLAVAMQVRAG